MVENWCRGVHYVFPIEVTPHHCGEWEEQISAGCANEQGGYSKAYGAKMIQVSTVYPGEKQ